MNDEHHSLLHGDLDEDDLLPNVKAEDEHPLLRHGGLDEDYQPCMDQLHSGERPQALACLLLVQQEV